MLLTALLAGWSSVIQAQASFDPNSLEFERTLLEKIPESKPEKAGNSKKKSKNKSSELEVEALFVLDAQRLEGLFAEQDTSTRALVRRARVGLSKELSSRLKAELSLDVDEQESEASIRKASVEYRHKGGGSLEVGLFKPDFGMEQSTSSRKIRTLERSMASDAFSPDSGIGLAWRREHSRVNLAIGAFLQEEEDTYDLVGRIAVAPISNVGSPDSPLMHIGVSAYAHSADEEEFRIRSNGGVQSADNFVRSAEYTVSQTMTVGGEIALAWKALTLQAEWFQQTAIDDDASSEDEVIFAGGYAQLAWLFGGARREYSNGVFDRIRAGDGLPLELVASFEQIDLRSEGLGNIAEQMTVGLNYRMNRQLRFMAHYLSTSIVEGEGADEEGKALVLRMQAEL